MARLHRGLLEISDWICEAGAAERVPPTGRVAAEHEEVVAALFAAGFRAKCQAQAGGLPESQDFEAVETACRRLARAAASGVPRDHLNADVGTQPSRTLATHPNQCLIRDSDDLLRLHRTAYIHS